MALLFLLPLLPAGASAAQHTPHRADERGVWQRRKDGELLPLKEIERRTAAKMPGWQYLGVDFDRDSGVYTLKFLRNGSVSWVEVDGHTGEVIGRAGH